MDLTPYHQWIVLGHVLSVVGLVATHGTSMAVVFAMRREHDRARLTTMLTLSPSTFTVFYVFGLLVIATGILAGLSDGAWTSGLWWPWVSVVVFVLLVVLMYVVSSPHFVAIRTVLGLPTYQEAKKGITEVPSGSDEELDRLLRSPRSLYGAAIGIAGIVILAWLMMIKPF